MLINILLKNLVFKDLFFKALLESNGARASDVCKLVPCWAVPLRTNVKVWGGRKLKHLNTRRDILIYYYSYLSLSCVKYYCYTEL